MLQQVSGAAWQASDDTRGLWQSNYDSTSRWLLEELLEGRRNLTITSLGGSASAWRNNYGFHLASHLERDFVRPRAAPHSQARVRFFNPSHGYTGSDWASLYLDTLVPPETDVLLWEFAVNDWPGQGSLRLLDPGWPGLKATTWHSEAMELFVRRAFALNPRMTLGLVFLWQPQAARCWPRCEHDDRVWRDNLEVMRHYARHIDAFALDVNYLAKNHTSVRHLFRDQHHPSDEAHAAIGKALFHRFMAVRSPPTRVGGAPPNATLTAPRPRRIPQSLRALSVFSDGLQAQTHGSEEGGELLRVLLRGSDLDEDSGSSTQRSLGSYSYYYGEPRFGPTTLQPVSPAALQSRRTGKVMVERVDNVQHVLIPPCSQDIALVYALRGHVRRPRFVGINFRGPDGYVFLGAIEALDHALQVNVTMGGGNATEALTLSAMPKATVDTNLTVVGRGVFAPQAWYAIPHPAPSSTTETSGQRQEYTDVQVRICRRLALRLGHNASLRNALGTFRSTYENVQVVGGVVVLT